MNKEPAEQPKPPAAESSGPPAATNSIPIQRPTSRPTGRSSTSSGEPEQSGQSGQTPMSIRQSIKIARKKHGGIAGTTVLSLDEVTICASTDIEESDQLLGIGRRI